MATINISIRECNGKLNRVSVASVNLGDNVSKLKETIGEMIKTHVEEIELIYCGQCLRDDKPLNNYGVENECTLFALKRQKVESTPDSDKHHPTSVRPHDVITALQTCLRNPAYRSIVEKLTTDPESIASIVAATPELEKDPLVIAMLQDPELLTILTHPNNINKVIDAHPAFGHAAMVVAAAVNSMEQKEEARSNRGTYSLDQMSDEEDNVPMHRPVQMAPPGGSSSITASQLSAALMAAGGSSQQSSGPTPSGSAQQMEASPIISADFFQQAMLHAQSAAVTESQLQHLRDMGITDEAVARQALQATGGNIQAALDLIFGDERS